MNTSLEIWRNQSLWGKIKEKTEKTGKIWRNEGKQLKKCEKAKGKRVSKMVTICHDYAPWYASIVEALLALECDPQATAEGGRVEFHHFFERTVEKIVATDQNFGVAGIIGHVAFSTEGGFGHLEITAVLRKRSVDLGFARIWEKKKGKRWQG